MQFLIKGTLKDSKGNSVSGHIVLAYQNKRFLPDDLLGNVITRDDGTFSISFSIPESKMEGLMGAKEPEIFLKVQDVADHDVIRTEKLKQPIQKNQQTPPDQFEAVVVGSGFGGTILGLTLANKFSKEKNSGTKPKKVCILERGQWWVSHEMPDSPGSRTFGKPTMREYFEQNNIPYRLWAYPDNMNGLLQLFQNTRIADRNGIYDYRALGNVHVIAASAVGGGSLVYANATEKPDDLIFDQWQTKLNLDINSKTLQPYFDAARTFIGVNKITTTAPLGTFKLSRTKAFQDAAEKLRQKRPDIIQNMPRQNPGSNGKIEYDFDADLSITDIPQEKDTNSLFHTIGVTTGSDGKQFANYQTTLQDIQKSTTQTQIAEFIRKYQAEANACERQGRCVLGCIPGARHTLNKQIFQTITAKPDNVEVRPLCEAYDIEPLDDPDFRYKIYYLQSISDTQSDSISQNSLTLNIEFIKYRTKREEKAIICKSVFIAAGSIGSTELLLKSTKSKRNTGKKLILSDKLGNSFSTNGDLLGVVNKTKMSVETSRGPVVTSAIKFREKEKIGNQEKLFVYTIEDSGVPKMFEKLIPLAFPNSKILEILGTETEAGILNEIKKHIINFGMTHFQSLIDAINPMTKSPPSIKIPNVTLPLPDGPLTNFLLFSGMGNDSADGIIDLPDNWDNEALNQLKLKFDLEKQKELFQKLINAMSELAKEIGEKGVDNFDTPLYDPDEVATSSTVVLHPLGGCSMGKDRTKGVVDTLGRVYDASNSDYNKTYDGLYVVDGAIMPTSLGINSSLTIAALAFRIAEKCPEIQDNIAQPQYLPVESVQVLGETKYLPR